MTDTMTDTTMISTDIERIAAMLYTTYAHTLAATNSSTRLVPWDDYAADATHAAEAAAWRKTAADTPGILAAAGITSVQDTVAEAGKSTTNKALSIVYTLLAAALGAVAGMLSGCGHEVSVTPDGATICRDGACLVVDGSAQTITYTQHAPTPDEIAPAVTTAAGDK